MNRTRLLNALLLAALFTGCATPGPGPEREPRDDEPVIPLERLQDDPLALLDRARSAAPTSASRLRLQAALIFEDRGDTEASAELLPDIDPAHLDACEQFRLALLQARVLLDRNRPRRALEMLRDLPEQRYADADEADQRQAGEVRARAFATNGLMLDAVRERIFLDGLLRDDARDANQAALWAALTEVESPAEIAARPGLSRDSALRGWLELATIAETRHATIENREAEVVRWQQRWPNHRARGRLPPELDRLPELIANLPHQVALLLPLSGPLGSAGAAVRDGFMAAHFKALAANGGTPGVMLFDTANGQDIRSIYMQAVAQGAELVIGPLAREAVRTLADFGPRDVPVLALNTASGMQTDGSLIQFGLIPEDEGEQIADRAWRDGHRRALVLTADDGWAERLLGTFEARFEALGGKVVVRRFFASNRDIDAAVASSLLLEESEARSQEMRRVLAANLNTEPRARQDLDFVLIAAEPAAARTLKPTLAYHFAGHLPIYASSHMYAGSASRRVSGELDDIRFLGMPWRLAADGLRDDVERVWPDAQGGAAAFYAMGVDAWHLQTELPLLRDGHGRFNGVTGNLRLDADGRLARELSWAVLQNGRPVALERVRAPLTGAR